MSDYLSILSDNRYLIHRLLIDYLSITPDYELYRLSTSGSFSKNLEYRSAIDYFQAIDYLSITFKPSITYRSLIN